MPEPVAAPSISSDEAPALLRRVLKWCAITLGVLVIVLGLALGAFTVLMARVPEYRTQMQAWLSERARLDIQFESARAGWRGYGPELVFTKVVVRSPDRQRVLAIAEQGGVGFDLGQALRSRRLLAARVSLQGTEIKVQRRVDGDFEFVGQADWPEFETNPSFTLDSLPVGSLNIRDVRLLFRDLQTGRGPWLLDKVELDILRTPRSFDIEAQANLPPTLGKGLRLAAQGTGKLNEVAKLQWRAEIAGTELDLRGWTQVMPNDWIAPAEGHGSFQFNAEFVGAKARAVRGRVDFVDVSMKLPTWSLPLPQADALQVRADDPESAPAPKAESTVPAATSARAMQAEPALHYRSIGLAFRGAQRDDAWQVHVERLQLDRDSNGWTPGKANVFFQFAGDTGKRYLHALRADAEVIVLENLWPLLAYLPENSTNARLRALNTSGRVMNLALRYERDAEAGVPRYGVRAEFAQLGISPVGKTPGFNGVSGVLTANGMRGELRLDSRDASFSMPRLFRTPLPVEQVTGVINWTRSADGLELRSQNLAVRNDDGKAAAQFTLNIPRDGVAVIDLHATGTDLQTGAAPRYMPAGVMTRRTLLWLDSAFSAGVVRHADAVLKGPLNKFPFRGGEGVFDIKAHIDGLHMDYQPGWMPANGLVVDANFHNAGMSAVASAGRINDIKIERAEGRIRDFRDTELEITATSSGDLRNALTFVQQSPVGPAIGNLFQQLSGQGALRAQSTLFFPLKDFSKRKVDINVSLQEATLRITGIEQPVEQLNGSLRVFNDAVIGANLRGRFLQGDFTTTAEPISRGRFNLVSNGQAQAQLVTQFLKLPAWAKIEGSARYRHTMPGYAQRDASGVRHLYSVDSDLRGLAINIPAPVNKPAASARNFHLDADLRGEDMTLRAAMGDLRALLRLQSSNDGWRLERGGLRADGIAAALPGHTGLRIDGHLENFVLDDWLRLGNTTAIASSSANTGKTAARLSDVLRAANVNIDHLRLYGFEWPAVRGILQATDAGWRVDLAGEQASGEVLVPYDFTSNKPLTLNMDTLHLTSVAATSTSDTPRSSRLDPRDLPALRADIKHFKYGEHDFGALQVQGTRSADGLLVSTLNINGESFSGTGTGSWLQGATGQQNTLMLMLDSSDVRATMQQFNYGDFISGKRGKLIANLHWPDGLDENLLGRASGSLEVLLDEGQLLNVQPGAGRVLGLLSVAALPRRLGLDFHDLTDKGLSFDRIHADFTVQNGDARTQNLLLRGPTADIGIVGRMGLGKHDYDQTAVVTGDVSSALPVAGVVAAGPVIGAALLLFSQIFKEPLKGVARAYYHIGGTWDNPQVERIDAEAGKASLSESGAAQ